MISRLRLMNFKAFEDQEVIFRPLTLLAGLNGMGKSSVLQALLLLRQSHDRGLLQNNELDLNGDLLHLGTGRDVLFESAKKDEIGFEVDMFEGAASWRFFYNRSEDVLSEGESKYPDETVFKSNLFNDGFHYLQAERLGPRIFSMMSEYMVRQHKQIGAQGEYAIHYLSTFAADSVLEEMMHPDSETKELKSQVEAWMQEISPGTRLNLDEYNDLGIVRIGVAFSRSGEVPSRFYSAPNVGFGISYTLPILVAILSAKEDTLILLENPEAHLHPRGQAQLGNLLARAADAGVQIIVETHSDHILNGIRISVKKRIVEPEDVLIHYFYRDDEDNETKGVQVTPIEVDKHGKLANWPPGFFDEYGKSLDELL